MILSILTLSRNRCKKSWEQKDEPTHYLQDEGAQSHAAGDEEELPENDGEMAIDEIQNVFK